MREQDVEATPARESVDVERLAGELRRTWVNGDGGDSATELWKTIARRAIELLAPPRDSSPAASGTFDAFVEAADALRGATCDANCDAMSSSEHFTGCPRQMAMQTFDRERAIVARDSSAAESGRAQQPLALADIAWKVLDAYQREYASVDDAELDRHQRHLAMMIALTELERVCEFRPRTKAVSAPISTDEGEMKACPMIPLSRDLHAVVSQEDYARLSLFKWYAAVAGSKTYAARSEDGAIVYMHREIMAAQSRVEVDHIDGNGLNNRRENLRLASHRENLQNQQPSGLGTSTHKGVYRSEGDETWRVQIKDGGRSRCITGIAREDIAAAVYDLLALDRFGDRACFNDPDAIAAWNTRATPPLAPCEPSAEFVKAADEVRAFTAKAWTAATTKKHSELNAALNKIAAEHEGVLVRFDNARKALFVKEKLT